MSFGHSGRILDDIWRSWSDIPVTFSRRRSREDIAMRRFGFVIHQWDFSVGYGPVDVIRLRVADGRTS